MKMIYLVLFKEKDNVLFQFLCHRTHFTYFYDALLMLLAVE
jgi:hypothetical protein